MHNITGAAFHLQAHVEQRGSWRGLRALLPSMLLVGMSMGGVACIEGLVPVQLNVPTTTLDLDAPRVALEAELCRSEGTFNCSVLADLDAFDGVQGYPFSLPTTMPMRIRTSPSSIVDVPQWFADVQTRDDVLDGAGIDGDALSTPWMPSQIVPLAIDASAFARLTPAQLEGLTIQQAHVAVADNGLTVDMPAVDIYLGTGFTILEDGTSVPANRDAAVHIAQSAAHPAGEDGVADVEFAAGAVAAMITALQSGDAWLELIATDNVVTLLPGDVKDTLRRPGGTAQLALELRLGVPVSVADLMDLSSTGTEGLEAL